MNQGGNLQNCIIFLSLYQRSTTTSDATTNPPAAAVADRARGGRGRGRGNYRGKGRGCGGFRNRIYSNNRGGPYRRGNSRKNSREDYSGGSKHKDYTQDILDKNQYTFCYNYKYLQIIYYYYKKIFSKFLDKKSNREN
jgi:hypothetical protein